MTEDFNVSIDDVLNQAVDLTGNEVSYVTEARLTVGAHEAIIDLYRVGPNPQNPKEVEAQRLHRIIMPISLAKNLSALLSNAVDSWEATFGITLPLIRQHLKEEDDYGHPDKRTD